MKTLKAVGAVKAFWPALDLPPWQDDFQANSSYSKGWTKKVSKTTFRALVWERGWRLAFALVGPVHRWTIYATNPDATHQTVDEPYPKLGPRFRNVQLQQ